LPDEGPMERPRRDAVLWHRTKRDATFHIILPAAPQSPFPQWDSPDSPIVTFAAPPPCLSFTPQKTTLEIVKRHYTIARIKGGMKFTCARCAHHVSTFDFDSRDGNLRTQAATAINRHATSVHHEPVMFSSLDVQQRAWRS
jgi:hypothetical protein